MSSDPNDPFRGNRGGAAPVIPDYEVIKPIGAGSYGEVWLGRSATGQYCAIKIVKRERFNDQKPYDREFSGIQKFEGVSRSHDSQVDILHVGRGDGCFYYVMELADDAFKGRDIDPEHYAPHTLSGDMLEQGALPIKHCIEIGLTLTTALHHLHEKGLVHRDVKPSNIIFVNDKPKLADIGLVSSADATMSVVGTEGFIAPEGPGSPKADVYSLGKVLYEAATGLDRTHYPELPTGIAEIEDRERFLELNEIIAKACLKDPDERYESAEAMQVDLVLVKQGQSIRRSRMLERQLGLLKRAAVFLMALSVFGAAAWFYQAGQTEQMTQLAESNQKLADDKDELVREKQKQVLGFQVERGIELMEEKTYARSLLWLTKALENVEPGTTAEEIHRIRINQVLKRIPRLDHVLVGNGATVEAGAISPDDRTVATAGFDGVMDFWNPETGGRSRESIVDPDGAVHSIDFLNHGERILTKNNRSMRLWDFENGTELVEMRQAKPIRPVSFSSPNARYVITRSSLGDISYFQLWDTETGEKLHKEIVLIAGQFNFFASFRNDSSAVLIGNRGTAIHLINTEHGRNMLPPIVFKGRSIHGAGFLSDDQKILVLTKQSETPAPEKRGVMILSLMDATSGKLITDLHTFDSTARKGSLTFGPSRQRVLCNLDDETLVLNLKNLEEIKIVVDSVDVDGGQRSGFANDELELFSRNAEYGTRYWRVNGDYLEFGYELPGCHWSAHSGNKEFILGAHDDKTAKIWSACMEPIHRNVYGRYGGDSFRIAYNPDGQRLVSVGLHPPTMWSLNENNPRKRQWELLDSEGYDLAFSPDGSHLALRSERKVPRQNILHSLTDKSLLILRGHDMRVIHTQSYNGFVHDLVFNAAGNRMFVLSSTSVSRDRVIEFGNYSLGTWAIDDDRAELLNEMDLSLEGKKPRLRLSPFGKLLAVRNEEKISAIRSDTGEEIWRTAFEQLASSVQFSKSEDLLAVIVGDRVHLLNAASGNSIGQPIENTSAASGCEFDPSGRYMAFFVGSDKIRIVELDQPWRVISEIESGSEKQIASMKFRYDGALLLTTHSDGEARLWDTASGDPVSPWLTSGKPDTTLEINSNIWKYWMQDADFHPDGTECVVSFRGGAITSFDLSPNTWPTEDLKSYAEAVTGLTIDENNDEEQIYGNGVRSRLLAVKERHSEYWETSTRQLIKWHESKVELAKNMNNPQGAKVHLEVITNLEGATAHDLLRIAEAHVALGNLEQAANILRGVIKTDRDHYQAWATLGLIQAKLSRHVEAKKIADQLLDSDGALDDPEVVADVAMLCILYPEQNITRKRLIAVRDGRATSALLAEDLAWLHGLENDWYKAEEIVKPFLERTQDSGIERKGMALVLAAAAFNRGDLAAGREFAYVYGSPEFEQTPHFGTNWRSALALDLMEKTVKKWLSKPLASFGTEGPPAREYLARDARCGPNQIDLSEFYNAMLMENLLWGRRSRSLCGLANFPRGHVEFDGVVFDVRGVVQLNGATAERNRNAQLNIQLVPDEDFPEEVLGIRVNRSAARLHFLHAAVHTIAADVGHYTVHYADGTSVEIPLVQKQNIDEWWFNSSLEQQFEETPATKIAWTGTTPAATGFDSEIRVFKFTWENPHPDKKIATLDFVSKDTDAAPFLIALTAE